jgi:hypothetical protein
LRYKSIKENDIKDGDKFILERNNKRKK